MLRLIFPICALLASIALLLVGSGLLNTLLALRGTVVARVCHARGTLVARCWTILGPAEGPAEAHDGQRLAPQPGLDGAQCPGQPGPRGGSSHPAALWRHRLCPIPVGGAQQ